MKTKVFIKATKNITEDDIKKAMKRYAEIEKILVA